MNCPGEWRPARQFRPSSWLRLRCDGRILWTSIAAVKLPPIAALTLLAGALATASSIPPRAQEPARRGVEGRRVEVLFLGHTRAPEMTDAKAGGWYHDSDRFAPMLKAALAPYGF